jgi:hypothetical protein
MGELGEVSHDLAGGGEQPVGVHRLVTDEQLDRGVGKDLVDGAEGWLGADVPSGPVGMFALAVGGLDGEGDVRQRLPQPTGDLRPISTAIGWWATTCSVWRS